MIYSFSSEKLPVIREKYVVVRSTEWEIVDPYHILIVVLDGRCRIGFCSCTFEAEQGDVCFIPGGYRYRRNPVDDEPCRLLYIHFDMGVSLCEMTPDEAAKRMKTYAGTAEKTLISDNRMLVPEMGEYFLSPHMCPDAEAVRETVARLVECTENVDVARLYLLGGYFSLLLCLLTAHEYERILGPRKQNTEEMERSGDRKREKEALAALYNAPPKLRRALRFIHDNREKKITLRDLCSFCGVSDSLMIRTFRDTYGTTPLQYILEYKVNCAKELFLNNPQMTVLETAQALGFEDVHYFSRVFSRIAGEAPGAFRRRVNSFPSKDGDIR